MVVEDLVPDWEAPEGSGAFDFIISGCRCLGSVPEVEGVGEECTEVEEEEPLELVSGAATGAGGDAEGTPGGVGACACVGICASVVPNGCSLGMDVQLY